MKMSRKIVLHSSGVPRFRQILQSQLDSLRQAPILLISSEASPSTSSNIFQQQQQQKPVEDACQLAKFTLGQQFGLRTVDTKVSSVFPTLHDVEQRLELMQRTGAASIVAVGGGAALDLAKAILQQQQQENSSTTTPLLLIPATYGALLASGASHSLLLDSVEEKLVPYPRQSVNTVSKLEDDNNSPDSIDDFMTTTVVSPLDFNKYMEPMNDEKASLMLRAVTAILLNTGIQKSTNPLFPSLLDKTVQLVTSSSTPRENVNLEQEITNLLLQSANLLSYGLPGGHDQLPYRSIPLALMASLLPTIFPQTNPIAFFASLVPGLLHVVKSSNMAANEPQLQSLIDVLEHQQQHQHLLPQVLVHDEYKGFSIPDMALSCIESNQQVWNCLDADTEILMTVLQHSISNSTK